MRYRGYFMKKVFILPIIILSLLVSACGETNTSSAYSSSMISSTSSDIVSSSTTSSASKSSSISSSSIHQHVSGEAVRENVVDATCEEDGSYDSVIYCTLCGQELSRDHLTIEAYGHDWAEPNYDWATDNTKVTARRICKRDNTHIEEETVDTNYQIISEATCTDDKIGRYTATFANEAFLEQTKDVVIEKAYGHNYDTPTYEWSDDYQTCTAKRVCLNDSSHIETETVNSVYTVTVEPTAKDGGQEKYTASFTNKAFEEQVHEIDLEPTGSLDKLKFTKTTDGYSVKALSEDIEGEVYIPLHYNGLPVTEVAWMGFSFCEEITFVDIADNVTLIDSSGFYGCKKLQNVNFGKGLKTIEYTAFSECSSLTSVDLPSSVTKIGDSAFSECTSLKTANLGSGVTSMGAHIFYNNETMESLTTPIIGSEGFNFLGYMFSIISSDLYNGTSVPKSLKELIIPDSCTYIDNHALIYIDWLEKLTIPFLGQDENSDASLSYIFGGSTYEDNATLVPSTLREVTIGNKCKGLSDNAFDGCSSIETINLGENIESIGYRCFRNCTALESLAIPEKVKTISDSAFTYTGLVSIVLPKSLKSLGNSVFSGSESLKSIKVHEDNSYYSSSEDILYNKDKTTLICCPSGYEGAVVIPDSVEKIDEYAFYLCKKVTSITIPDSVVEIGRNAFAYCESLTEIELPDSIEEIPVASFAYCTKLKSISLPNNLTTIGNTAFASCTSLESIAIPEGLALIDNYVFADCSKLSSITIPSTVTSLGEACFLRCVLLDNVELPSKLTTISDIAFAYCSALKSITLPHNSVTSIGLGAFAYCESLESFELPYYVTEISDNLFVGCTSLSEVTILPYDYVTIGEAAFANCKALETIELPGVKTIKKQAFYGCESLMGIGFDDTLKTIGDYCFYNCTALEIMQYVGTTSIWSTITKGTGWKYGVPATVVICSNGNVNI